MFVNILTADDKYSLVKTDNLRQPIQMQETSEAKNIFSISFLIFESWTKFWTFLKKDDPDSWCISEITDSEIRGETNV